MFRYGAIKPTICRYLTYKMFGKNNLTESVPFQPKKL
jgi:hypothetical protein